MVKRPVLHQLLMITALTFAGCSSKKTAPVRLAPDFRTIFVDTGRSLVNVSTLANQLTYIPLETTERDIIGKIDKIIYFDEKFFILDRSISKCLFVANKAGKFLYHKKAASEGAEKFRTITDFAIDRQNKLVYLYDDESRRVFCFDAENGAFRKSFPVKGYFTAMLPAGASTMLLYRDGITSYNDTYRDRLCLFDPDFNFQRSWLDRPINPFVNAGGMISANSSDGKRSLIARMFCDTIFSLRNDTLSAAFRVDAGRYATPSKLTTIKDKDDFMTLMMDTSTSYFTDHIFETRRYLAFYYKIKQSVCLILADKTNYRASSFLGLANDIDHTMLRQIEYMDDSCFVSTLAASELQQQFNMFSNDTSFRTRFKTLISLNQAITQDSNPVIVFGSMK